MVFQYNFICLVCSLGTLNSAIARNTQAQRLSDLIECTRIVIRQPATVSRQRVTFPRLCSEQIPSEMIFRFHFKIHFVERNITEFTLILSFLSHFHRSFRVII